ncbi:hypothetical protein VB776_08575 [Arcicella sp. DC2W]|uniref:FHA domain-containing protein n=1 Tax=Arcicella gelida TaxID=2984195 RepID=A0ABU5S3E5_9BACT|nr:hypothetical protein [Arcicella sp. DC2W]MEA5402966.1 hypothetical protein [Arcicella sp. DC2W]
MKKLRYLLLAILPSFSSHAAVIDPSNLAQNIAQVIQSKLMSKIEGDHKEIANSQLKTENQTTADVIGMNSTEKTRLNLEIAEFNYNNNPSDLIKNYYEKDMNIRGRNQAVLTHLQQVKSYFQQIVVPFINPLQKQLYITRFNGLYQGIISIDTRYQPFTNTQGNTAPISFDTNPASYTNQGETDTGLGTQVNTKNIENSFNAATQSVTNQLTTLSTLKSEFENSDGSEEIKLAVLEQHLIQFGNTQALNNFYQTLQSGGNLGNVFNNLESSLSNTIDELASNFQDQMVSTLSDALGVNIGGIFGGSANEKGKGKAIEINAKLGRLSDSDRIQLINKQVDLYTKMDSEISKLHAELIMIKQQHEIAQLSKDRKFNVSDFYKKSGAMDAGKMMNFDK